jgi:thiol-disulfide isomerase/thioredoxin
MRCSLFMGVLLSLLILLSFSGCTEQPTDQVQTAVAPGAEVGRSAPDFTLTDMQGQQVTLSELKGKVVILNFWATWCPPCRQEMPSMEELYRTYKDQGLVILAVNVEENGAPLVKRFLEATPYSFPILLGGSAAVQNNYLVYRLSETFIIDRNGNVVEKVTGAVNWTSGPFFKLVKFLVNG